jgi:hypothetical protein
MSRRQDWSGGRIDLIHRGGIRRLYWRRDSSEEIRSAQAAFDAARKQDYRAFGARRMGSKRRIDEFDAGLAHIIMVPATAGTTAALSPAGLIGACRAMLDAARRKPQPEALRPERARREMLALLLGELSMEQRRSLRLQRYLQLRGGCSGEMYRIHLATRANIEWLDARGNAQCRLCIAPSGELPDAGVMAAQLLQLRDPETEHAFLAEAAVHPAAPLAIALPALRLPSRGRP